MKKIKILHNLCDALMTDAKMHIVVDALVQSVGEYSAFEKLPMLLACDDEELAKLPNLETVDPVKVEKLVREERAKYHNSLDQIMNFGPITDVNIFTNCINYKYEYVNDDNEKFTTTGSYFYGDEKEILKDTCID